MSSGKEVDRFYRPVSKAEEWKELLAKPNKHWRSGYSAKALAYCWQEAEEFPLEVKRVFCRSGMDIFKDIEILVAFLEYKVPLPGGRRASQSDIFIIARGNGQLVSVTVEGKVSEPFGDTVAEWRVLPRKGRETKLRYLCNLLELDNSVIGHIRYQLLHRRRQR